MRTSGSIATVAKALVAAQADIKTLSYDSENPHFHSKFVSLTKILETVRPILAKHGLALVQGGSHAWEPSMATGSMPNLTMLDVETILVHECGEWIASTVSVPLAKLDPQGAGAAVTYGRRYSVSALLALATDEDDDGKLASVWVPAATVAAVRAASAASVPAREGGPMAGGVAAVMARTVGKGAVRVPMDGSVMPFGKTKGTPLADCATPDLTSALAWAQKNGKFAEFQVTATNELNERAEIERAAILDAAAQEPHDF